MGKDLHHWRRRLAWATRRASAGHDPVALHEARVATRRLRAGLELQGRTALVGDLRALGHALGPVRDLHVLEGLARAGGGRPGSAPEVLVQLRAWARAEGAAAQPAVARLLRSARTRGLLLALGQLPGAPGPGARRRLARLERRLVRALERRGQAAGAARAEATHALRRRVRGLRYALEALGEPTRGLAEVQEALGALGDALAVRRLLARWGADTGADVGLALARLDRVIAGGEPAPRPPPGSPARRRARSPGGRRGPSPTSR